MLDDDDDDDDVIVVCKLRFVFLEIIDESEFYIPWGL